MGNVPESVLRKIDEAREKKLTVLNLSRYGLTETEIPDSITELQNLTVLDLSRNRITKIPEFIKKLEKLTELDLGHNHITEISDSITKLQNLTRLDLGSNDLTKIPEFLKKLEKLTELDLGHNDLKETPESITQITQLYNLTKLDLGHNELREIPDSIRQLEKLTELDLAHNKLTDLPDSIKYLQNLTELDLRHNDLKETPESITQITRLYNLTKLDLGHNELKEIPDSIIGLQNLIELDLDNNELTEIPESITKLQSLEVLSLHGNDLLSPPLEVAERGIEAIRGYFQTTKLAPEAGKDERVLILHLSDLHFDERTKVNTVLQPLIADITRLKKVCEFERLHNLVISGDLTTRATREEFKKAREFVVRLMKKFELEPEQCVLVPGNHDQSWDEEVYHWKPRLEDLKERNHIAVDHIFEKEGVRVRFLMDSKFELKDAQCIPVPGNHDQSWDEEGKPRLEDMKERNYKAVDHIFRKEGVRVRFLMDSKFELKDAQCIPVPGNHDQSWDEEGKPELEDLEERNHKEEDHIEVNHIEVGPGYLIRDKDRYPDRFRNFSKHLYGQLFRDPYPLSFDEQAIPLPFEDTGILFLALNSAWEIDMFFQDRSSINMGALSRGLEKLQINKGGIDEKRVLRIGVWHHPVACIRNREFTEQLRRAGFHLALHGHAHEERADLLHYMDPKKIYVVGAGSFGAPTSARPESTPRLYNLLEVYPNDRKVRVHTRCRRKQDGAWEGYAVWQKPEGEPEEKQSFYEIFYDIE